MTRISEFEEISFDAFTYEGHEYAGSYRVVDLEPYKPRVRCTDEGVDPDSDLPSDEQKEVAEAHWRENWKEIEGD